VGIEPGNDARVLDSGPQDQLIEFPSVVESIHPLGPLQPRTATCVTGAAGVSHRGIEHLATRRAGGRAVLRPMPQHCDICGAAPAASSQIGDWMLPPLKRLLGWICGPLYALAIVLAVYFFERKLRLEIRRDPAWRSQEQL
jgi:hypothetical protein